MGWQYKVRKAYVVINPLLKRKAISHRCQWIMRNVPLIQYGVPFFFEPWVNPDDFSKWIDKGQVPPFLIVCREFIKEFLSYLQRRITGIYVSDDGTIWKWNPKTRTYEFQTLVEKPID
jgi:hypothetical protein